MGILTEFNMKSILFDYKNTFFQSKKYWLIFLILILILGLSTCSQNNLAHPKMEIIAFILVAVLGIFSIVFYFLHDSDEELYKVAFVIILIFGITTALIVPICDISDESEHLTRAEITSQGVLIPHWTGEDMGIDRLYNHTEGEALSTQINEGAGYHSIMSMNFFVESSGQTVFETSHDKDNINYSDSIMYSAFEQNPFYGYLPQAIGIFLAKIFDLNVIWILWLARIGNVLFYASVVSIAIRKTPVLKIPLLAVACIPITLYQASSASIDSAIMGLGILSIAYFISMCKAKEKSLTNKNIAIFTIICLLLGLCKLPYLAFILLLLFVPSRNFENDRKHNLLLLFIPIIIVLIIGLLLSRYSTNALMHSWRSSQNLVNSTLQLNYQINHPKSILIFLYNIFFSDLPKMIMGVFSFFGGKQTYHYIDKYHFITGVLLLYLGSTLLAYPRNVVFELKTKLGSAFVILLIYIATCFIQLLTWAHIGQYNLGISTRYFIPLMALLPVVIWIKQIPFNKNSFDKYAMIFMIAFMATLIISFATKYY